MNLLQITDNSATPIKISTENRSEKALENLIEQNPHIILGVRLLIIGRQVKTDSGKILDLLAIDKQGRLVVIELKKGYAPRDIIAQVLDYSSWLSSISERRIEDIAKNYFAKNGFNFNTLSEMFIEYFNTEMCPEFGVDIVNILFAQEFSEEVINPANYLASFDLPIFCIEFEIYKDKEQQYIITNNIVGTTDEYYTQEGSENHQNKILTTLLAKYLREEYEEKISGVRFERKENFKVHQTGYGEWTYAKASWAYDDGVIFCIELGIHSSEGKRELYSYFGNYSASLGFHEKVIDSSLSDKVLSSYTNDSDGKKTQYIMYKQTEFIKLENMKEFSSLEAGNLLNLVELL